MRELAEREGHGREEEKKLQADIKQLSEKIKRQLQKASVSKHKDTQHALHAHPTLS